MWHPLECLLGNAVITPSYRPSAPKPSPLSSPYLVQHSSSAVQFFSKTPCFWSCLTSVYSWFLQTCALCRLPQTHLVPCGWNTGCHRPLFSIFSSVPCCCLHLPPVHLLSPLFQVFFGILFRCGHEASIRLLIGVIVGWNEITLTGNTIFFI